MKPFVKTKKPLDVILSLPDDKRFMNSMTKGSVFVNVMVDTGWDNLIPAFNESFVFDDENVKNVLIGLERNIPILLHGLHGSGKTQLVKNIAAATGRPLLRMQHTGNMEESDVVGKYLVKDGETYFSPGPLALAMRNGWVICLDEYDVPDASILAVYQAVMEGDPLFIKEADEEWQTVHPHPDFRIIATANTNGSGDETGLYSGTSLGNAANYSRFGITCKVDYMKEADEQKALMNALTINEEGASKLVRYGNLFRTAFEGGRVTNTCSTRDLVNAGIVGLNKSNPKAGIRLSHINRLSESDAVVALELAQRVWG